MHYNKYGLTFKQMRKSYGFSLAKFSSIGLASSTLSDFERGFTMISLDKIDQALQLMGYSLSDFDSYLNNYELTDPLYIFEEVEKASSNNDYNKIKNLYQISQNMDNRYVSLSLKTLLGDATADDIEILIDFLCNVKHIGNIELSILYILIPFLHPKDFLNIIKNVKIHARELSSSRTYTRKLSHVLFEGILMLSKYKLKEESSNLLKYAETLAITNSMFLNNLFIGVKGYWIYVFENKKKGEEMINQCLNVFQLAAKTEISDFYHKKFLQLLKRK